MASHHGKQARPDSSAHEQGSAIAWVLSALLYLYVAALYLPVLRYGALSLDDVSMLRHAAAASVFDYDPFGHLRLGKNALFAWLAAQPNAMVPIRTVIIAAHLICIAGLQLASTRLFGSRWWGLLAAAIFALNPTTASAAAWLSASAYVLCMALLWLHLLTGRAALDRWRRGEPWKAYALAGTLAALLAGLQHELGLFAPLLFIASRRATTPDDRPDDKPNDRVPMIALGSGSAVAALVTLLLRSAATTHEAAYRMAEHGPTALLQHAGRYFALNMRLWLWERGAFGVLRHDAPQGHSAEVYLGWLVLLSALAVATWLIRTDKLSTFGLAWVALLLPVINIVPLGTTPVAMHYLYLPGAGLAFLVARGGQLLTRTLGERAAALRAAPVALLLVVPAAWQPEHVEAIARWGDDVLLYEASLASQPEQLEVRTNLVAAYLRRDRLRDADVLLESSLAMAPGNQLLAKNRFELLRGMGRPQEALKWLDAHPDVFGPEFLYRKAQLQELLGQPSAAIDTYARAADLTRDDEERYWASLHHARLLLQSGRSDEGLRALSRLVEKYPDRKELQVLRAGRPPGSPREVNR